MKITVADDSEGRLDATIAKLHPSISRNEARLACEEGRVLLNSKKARAGSLVHAGDEIEIELLPPPAARPEVAETFLAEHPSWGAVYEDDALVVVSKPRAMPSIRLRFDDPVTLADLLAARFPQCREGSFDAREAGLVQRLDFFTSGLVIGCKSRKVWQALHDSILSGDVEKTYLALVEGEPQKKSFTINAPLISADGGKRVKIADPEASGAQAAESKLRLLKVLPGNMSVMRVTSYSTKRHQVRVHLAHAGHPLVGDGQYGASTSLGDISERLCDGFLLQAETITFAHPLSGEKLHFAEQGEEFRWLLK